MKILKCFIAVLVMVLLVLFSTSFVFAAKSGEKCCGDYNRFIPFELYYPDSNGKACVHNLSPSQLKDKLGILCLAGPWLQSFCAIAFATPSFPVLCEGTDVCNPVNRYCVETTGTPSDEKQNPVCPSGYSDITDAITLNPGTSWDFKKGRACCKSDFLGQIYNPLKCLDSENLKLGTQCRDSRYVFRSVGNDAGSCTKQKGFIWMAQSCNGAPGVNTAIGCIPTGDLTAFLKFLLKFAFFASGGIIVLMIIATGYTLMTSAGNPEKLQAAKENIIALFSGLALIAFSLILLQIIGADVLKLPTF